MSSFADLTPVQKEELAVTLAALTCYDAEIETSADNLSAVLSASKVSVASYLPSLYSNLLARGIVIDKALAGPSAGCGSGSATGAAGASGDAPAAAKEEEEEEEEVDMGGGMDMFGGGDDY